MPTAAANLQTALDNLASQLADITANPKPDYDLDGQRVSWSSYLSFLIEKREALRKALQAESAPFWKVSKAKS